MITLSKKSGVVIGVGVGLLVLVMIIALKPSHKDQVQKPQAAPTASATGIGATHDSQVEQLKVLVAQVHIVLKDNETLKQQNATLQAALQHQTLAATVPPPVTPVPTPNPPEHKKAPSLLNRLSAPLMQAPTTDVTPVSSSLPIGRGQPSAPADHWVTPITGARATSKKDPWALTPPAQAPSAKPQAQPAPVSHKPPAATPVYTLPKNATLVGSRTMSALIGRVPVKGQVSDPYPFKIIQGPTNLAANGIRIPGLVGTIWSGMAVGDMNLTCVRGYMTSVTFVFDSGEINTVSEQQGNTNGSFSSNNFYDALGWISDPYGNPCLPGKFITNAPKYLATLMALDAASGAANAYAQSQTTNLVSGEGSMTSAVTGNNGAYVLGEAASNSTKELDQWIMDRMGSSFDAVYVASGQSIVMNLQQEIPIDHDVNHRSVVYGLSSIFYKASHLD